MSKDKGAPASFTDIAFDSGRIYERVEIVKRLERLVALAGFASQHVQAEAYRSGIQDALEAIKEMTRVDNERD